MFLSTGSIISNALGGLLAAAILTDLNGKLGIAGWRYLFYIEGAPPTVESTYMVYLIFVRCHH
jgi:MFS transporter, ACS family, DAL5 transporter family protein